MVYSFVVQIACLSLVGGKSLCSGYARSRTTPLLGVLHTNSAEMAKERTKASGPKGFSISERFLTSKLLCVFFQAALGGYEQYYWPSAMFHV